MAPLLAVAASLAVATVLGGRGASFFFPAGRRFREERLAWSFVIGCALVAATAAVSLAFHVESGWILFLVLGVIPIAAGRLRANASEPASPSATASRPSPPRGLRLRWADAVLCVLLLSGLFVFALRAMTEPMWSNDFLAIWGLKGRAIFFARAIPSSLRLPEYGFSHPEYPLGLPLLYAGAAFLARRWDDQALALLFPAFQAATVLALFGWLRRRGASRTMSLAAAAVVALFQPLYSAFAAGMADVPFAGASLLFAAALSDALDQTDRGARRRLGMASLVAAAIKNEGLFLAAAGAVAALVWPSSRRRSTAASAVLPAAALVAAQRLALGRTGLRDFDFAFLGSRIAEVPGRLAETLRAAVATAGPAWLGLLAVLVLLLAGRRTPHGDRILALAAVLLAAYVLLPALAVLGPAWLISTSLARTAAALAPMIAAGVTARLADVSIAASTDPKESAAHAEGPIPSTPAS
jgi:hypothetical protein